MLYHIIILIQGNLFYLFFSPFSCGCLWDVTDKDIDKYLHLVIDDVINQKSKLLCFKILKILIRFRSLVYCLRVN